jgi:hypothetical protein
VRVRRAYDARFRCKGQSAPGAMQRRDFVKASAFGRRDGPCWTACRSQCRRPTTSDATLRTLLDAILDEEAARSPQAATTWGLDSGTRCKAAWPAQRLFGNRPQRPDCRSSLPSRKARQAVATSAVAASRVDYDVIEWASQQVTDWGRRFPFGEGPWTPYAVCQLTGPYQSIPDFLATTIQCGPSTTPRRISHGSINWDSARCVVRGFAGRRFARRARARFRARHDIAQLQENFGQRRPRTHGRLSSGVATRAVHASARPGGRCGRRALHNSVAQRVYPADRGDSMSPCRACRPGRRSDAGNLKGRSRNGEAYLPRVRSNTRPRNTPSPR